MVGGVEELLRRVAGPGALHLDDERDPALGGVPPGPVVGDLAGGGDPGRERPLGLLEPIEQVDVGGMEVPKFRGRAQLAQTVGELDARGQPAVPVGSGTGDGWRLRLPQAL